MLAICIIFSVVVIINNRDRLISSSGNDFSRHRDTSLAEPEQSARDTFLSREDVSPDESEVQAVSHSYDTEQILSLYLPGIRSDVLGRDNLTIHFSVELFTDCRELHQEMLFKRNELRVMAIKVIRKAEVGAIRPVILKPQLLEAMNLILENDKLTDLEFRTFRIE
ncbi:hypothetical protein CHISP_0104 [Chitinispirillum alkaliphilum]|nr:hypothetical protein CHISP_0104 [Chitinispirillum alkaliphilum]